MIKYLRQFESVSQFVEFAEPLPLTQANAASIHAHPQLAGTSSREEAFRIFKYQGYPEGRKLMQSILEELTSSIKLPSLEYAFASGIEGCAPNVEAYIQGLPDDMIYMEPITLDAPPSFLSVQMEMCFNCVHSIESVALAGAIIFAAMEGLRLQGCNVEMLLTYTSQQYRSGHVWQGSFPITSQLDIDTASFIFTHASMLRRIVLAQMEQEPDKIRTNMGFNTQAGYGRPYHLKHDSVEYMLSIPQIIERISESYNQMQTAREIFQVLVDSKFQRIQ
jgi:hypothetical protein